jgi:hypothetical protein
MRLLEKPKMYANMNILDLFSIGTPFIFEKIRSVKEV